EGCESGCEKPARGDAPVCAIEQGLLLDLGVGLAEREADGEGGNRPEPAGDGPDAAEDVDQLAQFVPGDAAMGDEGADEAEDVEGAAGNEGDFQEAEELAPAVCVGDGWKDQRE